MVGAPFIRVGQKFQVVGGLLFSQFLTLGVTPVFFLYMDRPVFPEQALQCAQGNSLIAEKKHALCFHPHEKPGSLQGSDYDVL
jgi:hypothetical protein